ncbi:hypothetical protein NE237_010690 [Protea cynaroides]|uniref:Copper transport protein n=1 Tax=Protea cynaroides TaxID=273540 RepID=A0A9Q0L0A1_9MAGN|nr:hypothetical protein NE237_010690 [Protea cynaroides]
MAGGDDHMMHGEMMPSTTTASSMGNGMNHEEMMTTHMTFFWGKNAEILFSGWPGNSTGMYVFALILIFVVSVLVEWLSHSRFIKSGTNNFVAGLLQTLMHTVRMVLAYMVMLALMSFNVGVFLVAIAGHALGFLLFASRVFRPQLPMPSYQRPSDLPPMKC